ncbi:MAG: tRNA (N6-threonylcarbamoyladenosine(37)-N6)-methyltransferase TrmO [Chloroflexota bacterium]|nr:tRNA (N6-threonylcarbamoyladenosine(37)-N6)-methyltransferase TrmO [Chloroflexota bacterium]
MHYHPIGIIHSAHKAIAGMPIQPSGAEGIRGSVEVLPQYEQGLQDVDGFSHIILLYHFHQVNDTKLIVTPFMDTQPRGIFATRAPKRPNPIGLSVVKLLRIEGNILHIENVDILDGSPLLDIKPYVPEFGECSDARVGWLEKAKGKVQKKRSDDRFG